MKLLTLAMSVVVSLSLVSTAFSAEIVSADSGKEKMGVVSVSNASTLDDLVAKISSQADKKGASSFRILSASGNNKLHGVAEIYK
ncbi:TPA: DUF1471 domain-containing protein [Klebsiella quasipneumoniae subsp. similipneumoniae]